MWDWSGTKAVPNTQTQDNTAAIEAQNQGVTPMGRADRVASMYRDPRLYNKPQAPMSGVNPQQMNAAVSPNQFNSQHGYVPNQNTFGQQPFAQNPYQQTYVQNPFSTPQFMPNQQMGVRPMQNPAMNQFGGYNMGAQQQMPQSPMYPQQYAQNPFVMGAQPQMSQAPAYPQQYAQNPFGMGAQPQMPQNTAYPQQYAQSPFMPQQMNSLPNSPNMMGAQQSVYGTSMQPNMHPGMASGGDAKSMWEWQFSQMDLPNMDLVETDFVMLDPKWMGELRKAFKRTRRDFLKYVGYHHVNELIAAGMDEEAIKTVKKGKAPENFNIHLRVPFEYGGTNNFSNLCLIQTHPYHADIHKFIDMQTLQAPGMKPMKLYIPTPKGKVYFTGDIEISSGGTTRHDRSVYAGFLESVFEIINQKSMPGR